MKKWIPLVMLPLLTSPSPSGSAKLPSEATYHFFIHGAPAGTNVIFIEEKGSTIHLTSITDVTYEDFELHLVSRTEADAETSLPYRFSFEGTKGADSVSGSFWVSGDSITGSTTFGGIDYPWSRKGDVPITLLLENYLMEHEILIARAFLSSGAPYFMRFNLVFPSNTYLQTASIRKETEREFQAGDKAVICHKLRIDTQGSSVYSFADKEQELPIYLFFPATLTECFLESYFGEKPKPFYRKTEETPDSATEER